MNGFQIFGWQTVTQETRYNNTLLRSQWVSDLALNLRLFGSLAKVGGVFEPFLHWHSNQWKVVKTLASNTLVLHAPIWLVWSPEYAKAALTLGYGQHWPESIPQEKEFQEADNRKRIQDEQVRLHKEAMNALTASSGHTGAEIIDQEIYDLDLDTEDMDPNAMPEYLPNAIEDDLQQIHDVQASVEARHSLEEIGIALPTLEEVLRERYGIVCTTRCDIPDLPRAVLGDWKKTANALAHEDETPAPECLLAHASALVTGKRKFKQCFAHH